MAARDKAPADREIDRLFELTPEGFVAARDDLANRLKAEGRAEEAARVRSLRRPTVAAWAANQVARRNAGDITELLDAGAAMRQAQRKVLSGVKGGGFREAMDRRRRAVSGLTKAAERFLAEAGKGSAGVIEAVGATFEAATLDQEAAEQLRAGRLSKELPAPSGFGGAAGLELVQGRAGTKSEPPAAPSRAGQEAAREAKELVAAAAQARRRAMKAREIADRLSGKLKRLESELEEARAAAREANREARDGELDAERAQSRADRASRVTR